MKIAYNPVTETALGTAPNNNDIIFDLKGLNIFAKGTKFKGTDTTYSVFKKNTSSSGGGYNGLVPVPSYTTTNVRYLREDGTWQDIKLGTYLPLTGGTLTGALNFANNIWNKVGDDVAIGDCNNAGILGIKALNAAIPGIKFFNNSGAAIGTLTSNGGTLQWNGVNIFYDFSASNTLTQLTIGGITKSLTIPYSTKAGQLNTSQYSTGSLASLTNSGHLYYAGEDNTVSDKPSGVAAFGLFTMQTAYGYHGQILMSSNAATGLYWRTATTFNGGWRTLLDSSNYISYIKKIGTDTVGSTSKGIYLNNGVPTALSANVGVSNRPVYMSSGNIVPCSYTFGNANGNAAINNSTLCTNLNADMLDGKHLSQIGENGYIMTKYTIDASSLDQNTYYPVTFSVGMWNNTRIECRVSLNSGTKPSWSTHNLGFSVRKVWETNGDGWGVNNVNRRILISDYKFADSDPVVGIQQLTHTSTEYVYVRGGGKYFFYTSHNITPVLRTSTYTISEQSVSPTTTAPSVISRNVAYITDNVASATRLQTAHTINGTSFNGTADIITTTWGTTRTISLTGAVTGSVSTNGGSNIVINTSYGTDNITSLDSRYVKKVGDTMTGNLTTQGRFYIQQSGRTDKCCLFQGIAKDSCGIILLDSSGTENILRLTTTNLTWRNSIIWHAGNDGSGSGLDADLLDGKHASSFSLTTHTHSSIKIQDNRSTVMLPNNMGTQIVNTFFNMQDNMPNTQWWSGLHFTGWTSDYSSWQLAGPAGQSSYSNALYFRSGINSTWNSWKKILFNTDLTWENILNKPSSFTPSAHTHNYLVSRGRVTAESGTVLPALSGLSMSEAYSNGYPTTYGNVITLNGNGQGQLLIGWSSSSGGNAPAYIRSKRDVGSASWSSWAQLYTTVNKPSWNDILNKPTSFTPATHTHTYLPFQDTRNVDYAPYASTFTTKGLSTTHLKSNTTDGLSDGGSFHTSLYLYPWQDSTGGSAHNLAFTQNGNMWIRSGTTSWGSWKVLLNNTNYTTYINQIGTASVGNSSTPIFLNKGIPTVCTFRFGGQKNQPVVLFSGVIYNNGSEWSYDYTKSAILDNRPIIIALNGARMQISINYVTITSAAVHQSNTANLDGYSTADIKGRGSGAYWFSVLSNNSNSVFIRPIRQENGDNDSWFSSSSAWDNISQLSVTIFGYSK